jgi:hypothetical protein
MKYSFILASFYLFQERERDHFSQFITEGFTSYCKRKRRDKVCNIATQVGVYKNLCGLVVSFLFF